MPDLYVPIDTVELSKGFQDLAASGLINKFSFEYLDAHRAQLLENYKDFPSFHKQFTVPAGLLTQLIGAAAKSGIALPGSTKERILSLLSLEIKGQLASQLYAGSQFYLQVMNTGNASLDAALRLLEQSSQYNKFLKP